MNYLRPERLDALARDYAVGLMAGAARRRFETLLQQAPAAQAAVLAWQARLAPLAATVPPLQPSAQVWETLQRRLLPPPTAQPSRWSWLATLLSGRVLGGALAGVLLATVVLRQQPAWLGLEPAQETLPASYVGLLLDRDGKPALLASSRRHGRVLSVKMLQPLVVPAGQQALLWALPKDGGPAFLVGALPAPGKLGSSNINLSDSAEKLFFGVTRLGVSLEASADVAHPSGDFVLSGHCSKLW